MRTVVIVDDEPITRMDLADMLEEVGFSVAGEAADGFDAVEICRDKRPDVVLMDVNMPVFDGLTAAETILAEELAGCVVLLTAFSDREIIDRASKAGVTGYLVKPVAQQALLPAIEVAYAQAEELRKSRRKASEAEQSLEESRLIHKAQQLLAKAQQCTEAEAYQWMRKNAMSKRIRMAVLAEGLVKQLDRKDELERVKQYLRERKGLSDEKAYKYVVNYGRMHGLAVEDAAAELYRSVREAEYAESHL